MSADDFVHLSLLIKEAFPTEIPETYYVKGTRGGNATGKLRNQYLNLRTELAKVGIIQRKSRAKVIKPAEMVEALEEEVENALNLLQSCEIADFGDAKHAWEITKSKRMADFTTQGTAEYFSRFPILSTGAGYLLVSFYIFVMLN